jgi:hypothetical protein
MTQPIKVSIEVSAETVSTFEGAFVNAFGRMPTTAETMTFFENDIPVAYGVIMEDDPAQLDDVIFSRFASLVVDGE